MTALLLWNCTDYADDWVNKYGPIYDDSVTGHYDCGVCNCVSTEYLNQDMLAAGKYGELLDVRDNQVYRTIQIGNKVWTAQNMNYEIEGSFCLYNSVYNCSRFGRLYTWNAAMMACPEGWSLPSGEDFTNLFGVSGDSYGSMLAKGIDEWSFATDEFGFSALPAGAYYDGNFFTGKNEYGPREVNFWSSSTYVVDFYGYFYGVIDYTSEFVRGEKSGASVRCVKD